MLKESTAGKISKYGVFSGPYFPLFGLNTEIYFSVFSPNTGKYGPEKTPYLDTSYAVKHGINNTSKANSNSNNDKNLNTNKDHISNTNTSSKEKYKNKDNHKDKKNEKLSKERKRKQEMKETSMDQNTRDRKGKPSIFIMGDSMMKKLNGYLLTKKNKHRGIVKVRPFTTANVSWVFFVVVVFGILFNLGFK